MGNEITQDTPESLAAERAAVAMLLSAAAEAQAQPAPAEPVSDDVDLYALVETVEEYAIRLKALKTQESELLAELASVRNERQALERDSQASKTKLFEALFGKPERPTPPVAQPGHTPKPKLNNEVVVDMSVGTGTALPADAPPEARVVAKIPSMQF